MFRRYRSVRALMTIGTAAALAASRAARIRSAASATLRIGSAPRGVPSSRVTPTSLNDLGNRDHHRIGRFAVPRLDIRGYRHLGHPHDAGRRGDDFAPRGLLAVRITERPGETSARRGDRVEPGCNKNAGAHRIPRIWQQEQRRPPMLIAKKLRLLRLSYGTHLGPLDENGC